MIHPHNPAFRTLLASNESIDEVIDRAIESLDPDVQGAVIEGAVKNGVVTVAVAVKFKNDWSITIAGERQKDGALASRFQVKHTW
jgi:hypothetical protein